MAQLRLGLKTGFLRALEGELNSFEEIPDPT